MDRRKVSQHIVNHLIYAIDSEGKIVGVDDVLSGVDCACFCPACKELSKSKPNSLLEICAHTSKGCFDINIKKEYDKFKYIGYKQFKIKNCVLCENYVDSYNNTGKLCRLYKRLQIPKENLDTAKAKDCPCFKFNEGEMDSVLGNSLSENYTIYK